MSFLVAIPVFNEEKTVAAVVEEVKRYAEHILVVDDGSTDETPVLLGLIKGVDVIRHAHNRGYGASLIDAFAYACRGSHEHIITMDCDAQHEPRQIPQFIAAAPQADIISGSRYMAGAGVADTPPEDRRRVNVRITRIINEMTGYRLTDAFCGFKAYRVEPLCKLHLSEPGYGMPLQLWLQAARHGLTVHEIPVPLIYGDPTRGFGKGLDQAEHRCEYYLQVIERERLAPLPCCQCCKDL